METKKKRFYNFAIRFPLVWPPSRIFYTNQFCYLFAQTWTFKLTSLNSGKSLKCLRYFWCDLIINITHFSVTQWLLITKFIFEIKTRFYFNKWFYVLQYHEFFYRCFINYLHYKYYGNIDFKYLQMSKRLYKKILQPKIKCY